MPPKKKTPKTGFYFFLMTLQNQFVQKGMRKPSVPEMMAIAGPKWGALSDAEKEEYNIKAKTAKGQNKLTLEGKFTSDGKPISEVEAEILEKEQDKLNTRRNVQRLIENIGDVTNIAETDFIIMGFNILCCTDDGTYIPNELGIAKFSLNEGVKDKFHKFINPGPIPVGYTSDAKSHSESTHQIPIHSSDLEEFDQNYAGIYKDILRFAGIKQGETAFVYCLPDNLEQNASCLEWLYEKACVQKKQKIFFVDISYLLMDLAAAVGQPFSSEFLAENVLNQHSFDYCANIRCHFHEELDNAYCALAYPQRLSFILADFLCLLYDITVTEKHLPSRLTRNVLVSTWQPKSPIKPVINKVNVPLKPAKEHQITTFQQNARSIIADYDDAIIVPSMMAAEASSPVDPKEQLDIDDDHQFPSLGKQFSDMQICESWSKSNAQKQPRQLPKMGVPVAETNAWLHNLGRGSIVNRNQFAPPGLPDTTIDTASLHLGVGVGRGVRRKHTKNL